MTSQRTKTKSLKIKAQQQQPRKKKAKNDLRGFQPFKKFLKRISINTKSQIQLPPPSHFTILPTSARGSNRLPCIAKFLPSNSNPPHFTNPSAHSSGLQGALLRDGEEREYRLEVNLQSQMIVVPTDARIFRWVSGWAGLTAGCFAWFVDGCVVFG